MKKINILAAIILVPFFLWLAWMENAADLALQYQSTPEVFTFALPWSVPIGVVLMLIIFSWMARMFNQMRRRNFQKGEIYARTPFPNNYSSLGWLRATGGDKRTQQRDFWDDVTEAKKAIDVHGWEAVWDVCRDDSYLRDVARHAHRI